MTAMGIQTAAISKPSIVLLLPPSSIAFTSSSVLGKRLLYHLFSIHIFVTFVNPFLFVRRNFVPHDGILWKKKVFAQMPKTGRKMPVDGEYYKYVKRKGGGAIGIMSAGQKMKGAYKL